MDYDLVGMKVLIVEDMPDNAELIHKILKRLGLKIAFSSTGQELMGKKSASVSNKIPHLKPHPSFSSQHFLSLQTYLKGFNWVALIT